MSNAARQLSRQPFSSLLCLDPQQVDVLANAIERLIVAFQPESVYAFGSHARNTAASYSDLDLMLIVPASTMTSHERRRRAHEAVGLTQIPLDIHVWTQAEFDDRLGALSSLPATVLREGKLVYLADGAPRRDQTWLVADASKARREAGEWFDRAEHDLAASLRVLDATNAYAANAAFMAHLAADSALRASLSVNHWAFSTRMRLDDLLLACQSIDAEFHRLSAAVLVLAPLTSSITYPDGPGSPTHVEAVEAQRLATEVIAFVREKLREQAMP
jgi:HEPN domain-containing protein